MSGRMKTGKEGEELTVVAPGPAEGKKKRQRNAPAHLLAAPSCGAKGGSHVTRSRDRTPRGLFRRLQPQGTQNRVQQPGRRGVVGGSLLLQPRGLPKVGEKWGK